MKSLHKVSKIKLYVPLILVELYLLFTVWLLYYGPIIWPLENESKFLLLIALYHVSFISGYVICTTLLTSIKSESTHEMVSLEDSILKYYWPLLLLAFVASIISHRNITHAHSYIPWSFFSDLYRGLSDPAAVRSYYASPAFNLSFSGNKYVTATLVILSVFKYSLLPVLFWLWPKISRVKRIAGFLVLVVPLISGISISISSINFNYLLVMGVCFFVLLLNNWKEWMPQMRERKVFSVFFVFLLFFSVWHFYSVKSGISPYQAIVENKKPSSFAYLEKKNVKFRHTIGSSLWTDFYEKVTAYVVQGYVGMSIALGENFESSYGVGHSVFLQRVFEEHLGIPVIKRSFQHKITNRWDENVFWHSAYSHFANDVGFYGVCLIMLILGGYFSFICIEALSGNFAALLLLPLFGVMFLYIPANNQVFSFVESMSSFWILSVIFLLGIRKKS